MSRLPSAHSCVPRLPARAVSLALLVMLAATAGCGGGGSSAKHDGTTLRVAQLVEPTTLDPAQVQDGPTIELLMQVFEGLVDWNTKNEVMPALAEKWEISNGGKTYTFHIRQGAKFHDGQPVTAEDLAYSIRRSLDPETASPVAMTYLNDLVGAAEFNDGKSKELKSVEVVAPQTLRLTIDAPKAYFLSKLTYPTAYAVSRTAIVAAGGTLNEDAMIGTGPFKVKEYHRGDPTIMLEANADYWGGAPKLARIERRILTNDGARHDKFEAGELDITDVNMAMYRADKSNPKLSPLLKDFQRPAVYYIALNQNAYAPFKDKRVRQAFAMAVNKDELIQSVHAGLPPRANGVVPIGVPGYDPNFKGLAYDPSKAKALLAQAGFPDGKGLPPLTLSFRADVDDIRRTCEAIQEDLRTNLGVDVQLDATEWGVFLNKRKAGEMPFYFLRWMADYLDPQNFLSLMLRSGSEQNTIGYKNPVYDRLCDQADVMQDPVKRIATYRQAEKIVVDDAPWIPVYYQRDVELWNPKLQGVEDSLMGHLPHKRTNFAP